MLGENIKKWRNKRNLTQADLGVRIGLTQAEISRIESGKVDITVSVLSKVAKALNVSESTLFSKKR